MLTETAPDGARWINSSLSLPDTPLWLIPMDQYHRRHPIWDPITTAWAANVNNAFENPDIEAARQELEFDATLGDLMRTIANRIRNRMPTDHRIIRSARVAWGIADLGFVRFCEQQGIEEPVIEKSLASAVGTVLYTSLDDILVPKRETRLSPVAEEASSRSPNVRTKGGAMFEKHLQRILPRSLQLYGKLDVPDAEVFNRDYQAYAIDPDTGKLNYNVGHASELDENSLGIRAGALLAYRDFLVTKDYDGTWSTAKADLLLSSNLSDGTVLFGYVFGNNSTHGYETRSAPNCVSFLYPERDLREFIVDMKERPTFIRDMLRHTDLGEKIGEVTFRGQNWQAGIIPTDKLLWMDFPSDIYYGDWSRLHEAVVKAEHPNTMVRSAYRQGLDTPGKTVHVPYYPVVRGSRPYQRDYVDLNARRPDRYTLAALMPYPSMGTIKFGSGS